MERKAGVLLAISSLPGNQGIGDLGKQAYKFIDLLAISKVSIWQILPIHPLGYGNSPYQPLSTYAGDPIYINIDKLADISLLKQSSIRNFNKFSEQVDYDEVRAFKEPYLRKAYRVFKKNYKDFASEYETFCDENEWLHTYAVFVTLKKHHEQACWLNWPKPDREWIHTRESIPPQAVEDVQYEKFLQFIFFHQWNEVKLYANTHHVQIMGDMPIYVGIDSIDVWENQQYFLLDKQGHPTYVAGVPPDYFSAEGQRWGNPIYNWKRLKKERYGFWMKRLQWAHQHYDITRIDHFRAFDTYWKIPAECATAIEGEWVEGPGQDLFDCIYQVMPDIQIVAEDLGELRKEVGELRDANKLLGMRVLQFEMEPKRLKKGFAEHVILYSGTHDNMTLESWYEEQDMNLKIALRRFFHNRNYTERNFHNLVCHFAMQSEACVCILPMQDILGLKDAGRMNTPSTIGSPNWQWKLKNLKECNSDMEKIKLWIEESNRFERS